MCGYNQVYTRSAPHDDRLPPHYTLYLTRHYFTRHYLTRHYFTLQTTSRHTIPHTLHGHTIPHTLHGTQHAHRPPTDRTPTAHRPLTDRPRTAHRPSLRGDPTRVPPPHTQVDGSWSCGGGGRVSQLLLEELHGRMNFSGFVVTDWWATHSQSLATGLTRSHSYHTVPTLATRCMLGLAFFSLYMWR